ncbi:MAG: HAD-IA family hydrolase [Bacteroidia bacterium]|nr:HAD-IA family hydrolase [Bacteroidia bacterium]
MINNGLPVLPDPIKGVFFDMDGVLYDSMGAHADAWNLAFHFFGFDFSPEMVYRNEGRTAQSTINLVFQQEKNRDATEQEIEQIYFKKTEIIADFPDAVAFDGALALMKELSEKSVSIWVVTGSSQDKFLNALLEDFSGYVDKSRIINGQDVQHGKPHPEPYLMALKRSGLASHEVVVIENAPLGIQSAKGAGIFTIAVNTGILDDQVLWDSGADRVYKNMLELTF